MIDAKSRAALLAYSHVTVIRDVWLLLFGGPSSIEGTIVLATRGVRRSFKATATSVLFHAILTLTRVANTAIIYEAQG